MNPTDIRAIFPGLRDTTYLNTATIAVGCTPVREAYEHAVERWSAARFDWTEAERAGEDARAMFAEIVGARAEHVAIVPAVSVAAGIVASNLPDAARGENIVVAENEFSSNFFPWLLLRERGYDVRTVSFDSDEMPADRYDAVADGGTRLIAVSAVQSSTGYRADLAALSRVAARCGAWLFVDACQAAGSVPLDVARDGVDFLAVSSHKFLLGTRGMAYLYVRPALIEKMRPIFPGWKASRKPMESFYGPTIDLSPTASRLDTSLNWFAALGDQAALGLFRKWGIKALLDRTAHLSRRLHEALIAHRSGIKPFPEANRSAIVSIPRPDAEAVMARLRAAGVVAAMRAGRIRLSVHFYNLEEEIDRAAQLVAGA